MPRHNTYQLPTLLKATWIAVVALFVSLQSNGQTTSWQWLKSEASTYSESGRKVVVDELGNSYTAAIFTGTITVGAATYTSFGGSDILLVKYDAGGNRIWSKQFGSNQNDDVYALQYDKAGYLYLNGTFIGASFQYGTGSISNTTSGNLEVYLLRLDAAGNVKWGFHPQGNGQDYAGGVYSNGASVIITGNFQSPSIQFGPVAMSNASFRSMYLAKLDSTGIVQWAKQFGNGYIDAGNGVSMDTTGAIYVAGDLGSPTLTLGSTTLTRLGSGGTFDILLAKFDGMGNPIWARSAAGTGTEEPAAIATDENGNAYITGYFKSNSIDFSGTTLTNIPGVEQFFMARYDNNGNLKWVRKSAVDVQSRGTDISIGSSNKIFAAGYYFGGAINFNGALSNSGNNDAFAVQYDSTGAVSWSDKAGGTGDDKAYGIAGSTCGGVVTGEFTSATITAGSRTLSNLSAGSYDIYNARFAGSFAYNALPDTLRACGDVATLDAGNNFATYAWNTLESTQQVVADISGRYVVTVYNQQGCIASDSVYVSIVKANILQQDTIICKGNPVHLSIDTAYLVGKYFHSFNKNMNTSWNVAITTIPDARYRMVVKGNWAPSVWPTERLDPAYLYKLSDNSAIRKWVAPSDAPVPFTVNGSALRPTVDIYRPDHQYEYNFSTPVGTQFNIGFSEVVLSDNSGALSFDLYAMNNPVTVSWSTGSTATSIDVAPVSTTTYYVTLSDGISTCTDSVKVTVLDAPAINLPDTLKVCGDSVELDAGPGASSYSWNTGATSQKITVHSNGKYFVTAANALGCGKTDSVVVSLVVANILQSDTAVCKGNALPLSAQTAAGWNYSWTNSTTTSTTQVSPLTDTRYYLTVNDGITSCKDSIMVTVLALPQPALPDTLRVCGANAVLDAGTGFASYHWNDGSTLQTLTVTASGKYFVTVTNASGCSNTDSVYVSIVSSGIQENDTAICKGSSLLLNAISQSGYSYSWSTGETAVAISVTPAINTKYYLTVSDGIASCKDSISVTVLAVPQLSLPDTVKVCGSTTQLDAGAGFTTYHWSTGANTPVINVTVSGKYFITVTNANGCASMDSIYVSLMKADILQNDTVVCKGSSLSLQAYFQPSYSYNWSTGSTATSIVVNPTMNTKYYLQASNGIQSCSDSITVMVNNLPQLSLNDTVKVCGSQAQLDAGAGFSSYTWNTGSHARVLPVSSRGKYSVMVTDANGCSNSDTSFVSLVVAAILQGDTVICKGNTLTLQAAIDPAYNYQWSVGQTTPSINVSPFQTTRYYLQTSDGVSVCSDSVLVSLSIIDTAVTVSGATTFCQGGAVQLSAKNGYQYQWYKNGILLAGATTQQLSVNQSGNYKVILTNSNGCSDNSSSYTVVVNPLPLVSLNTVGPITVCEGAVINLSGIVTPNASGALQYQWWLNGVTVPGATTPSYGAGAAGNYSLSVINSNGCGAASIPVTMAVSNKPVISLLPSGTTAFCTGSDMVLHSSVNAGNSSIASYQWYKDAALITGEVKDSVRVNVAGQYSLVATNSNGCAAISSITTVTESALPVGTVIPPPVTKICRGVYATLQATGGSQYVWYLNGIPVNGATAATLNAVDAGNYAVKVINAAGCSNMASNTVDLGVIEVPKPDFTVLTKCAGTATLFTNKTINDPSDVVNYTWTTGDGNSYSSTDLNHVYASGGQYTVKLSAASTACPFAPSVKTIQLSVEQAKAGVSYAPVNAIAGRAVTLQARNFGSQYQWSPSQGLNNTHIAAPQATISTPQTYLVNIYTVTGCVTTDTQVVRVFQEREIYVPTAFTPNNDGKNDRLYPILAGVNELTYFRVYNRWGNLIFETRQASPSAGWDGTYKGQLQPTETYVWVAEGIDIDGKPVKRNGTTLLIR